jgi:hypothetical protein
MKSVSSSQPGTQQRPVVTKSQLGTAQTQHPSTLTGAASEVVTPPPAAKKNPMKIVLPAAAAVVLLAGGIAVMTKKPPPPPKPVAAAPAPAVAKPLPPSVPKVHIALKIDPPDAKIELDGIGTTDNPLELPQSETTHTIVISAPGKQSVTRELRAMTSGEIAVALQAEVKPEAAPVHHAGSGHAKPATPAKNKVRGPVETDL